MFLHYEWVDGVTMSDYDRFDRKIHRKDLRDRELSLREEIVWANHRYHVSYSAQNYGGRHARTVETKSFTSLQSAYDFLFELANKYAPQIVIDKISDNMKGI